MPGLRLDAVYRLSIAATSSSFVGGGGGGRKLLWAWGLLLWYLSAATPLPIIANSCTMKWLGSRFLDYLAADHTERFGVWKIFEDSFPSVTISSLTLLCTVEDDKGTLSSVLSSYDRIFLFVCLGTWTEGQADAKHSAKLWLCYSPFG
jgi:hypothetical protein